MLVPCFDHDVVKRELFFRMLTAMANFVVVPVLGVFAVNVNCFFDVWNNQAEVKSQYSYTFCSVIDPTTNQCATYAQDTLPTSYLPPYV